MAELLLGISEMHKKNICHRDMKPDNVLLSKHNHVRICDFGEAKVFNESDLEELAQYFIKFGGSQMDQDT